MNTGLVKNDQETVSPLSKRLLQLLRTRPFQPFRGNGLVVRLPGRYVKRLGLAEGMQLEVTVMNGGLVLRPNSKQHFLDRLVGEITRENVHQETDWAPPVGAKGGNEAADWDL